MATTSKTPNYQLPRPNETDIMDVADLQGIVDKVDAQMKVNATNIGLLEAGVSIWPNFTTGNVLLVSALNKQHEANRSCNYLQTKVGDVLNLPPLLAGSVCIVRREVYHFNEHNLLVKLTEMFPLPGRTWYNKYTNASGNISWDGWKSVTPV